MRYLKESNLDFPGSLVVRIPGFHCGGMGLNPGWGISRKPRVVAKKKKRKKFLNKIVKLIETVKQWLPGIGGGGNGELLSNGYRVSVMQDD